MNFKYNISERNLNILLIAIAFMFSIGVRLIWVYIFNDVSAFKHNGQFILTNADGFFFANIGRELIETGTSANPNLVGYTLVVCQKILPFVSYESIIFYIPIIFSSLIVIPLYFMGTFLYDKKVGFISALIGSIAVSYYNRTMVGYLDTDMLNITLPTFLLYFLIAGFRTWNTKYLLYSAIVIIIYKDWYPSSHSLMLAFIGVVGIYWLYHKLKKRDHDENIYILKMLIIMAISCVFLSMMYKFVLVLGLYYLFSHQQYDRYILYVLLVGLVVAYFTEFFTPFIEQIRKYVFKPSNETFSVGEDSMQLQFYNVINTVKEAQAIPFDVFAKRISGDVGIFVASVIGFCFLVYKQPIYLLSLPLAVIGAVAYGFPPFVPSAGLRFTIYLVPVMAVSLAYLIVYTCDKLAFERVFISYPIIAIFTFFAITPHIEHIKNYKIPTIVNSLEANVLSKLKNMVKPNDVVVSWWDFGYPITYYTGATTLIDGGRNLGADNFYVSYMLTHPQQGSARMARLQSEFQISNKTTKSNLEAMLRAYKLTDPNLLLGALDHDELQIEMPKKTREVYFYLPHKILDIYPVIEAFSNLDLTTGKPKVNNTFFKSQVIDEDKDRLYFMNGVSFLKQDNTITIGDQEIDLNSVFIKQLNKDGSVSIEGILADEKAKLCMLYNKSEKTVVLSNVEVFNSLYFQLFILGSYDQNLFEYVDGNYFASIYKLKI